MGKAGWQAGRQAGGGLSKTICSFFFLFSLLFFFGLETHLGLYHHTTMPSFLFPVLVGTFQALQRGGRLGSTFFPLGRLARVWLDGRSKEGRGRGEGEVHIHDRHGKKVGGGGSVRLVFVFSLS
ncbi:hypothetical protein QBC39DRAFT_335877 [Podospora conica]|nr:hypothetical protein QBC39DRAFT_335877 [Schizothecium conicum]